MMMLLIIKIFLKIMKAKLISIFILSVFVTIDLNCIIGEMDKLIRRVIQLKLVATCPNISFIIPVPLDDAVEPYQEHIASDIKFALIIQERPVNIFLDDECFLFIVGTWNLSLNPLLNLIIVTMNGNPVPSIRVLSWFDNPQTTALRIIFHIFIVIISKLLPRLIIVSFHMKSYRQIIKYVLPFPFIICFHIIIECFFVSQKFIILEMIMNLVLADLLQVIIAITLYLTVIFFTIALWTFRMWIGCWIFLSFGIITFLF